MTLVLQTPGTGLSDLEAKLAYGLVYVTAMMRDHPNIKIIPQIGFHQITLDIEGQSAEAIIDAVNEAYRTTVHPLLEIEQWQNVIGVQKQSINAIQEAVDYLCDVRVLQPYMTISPPKKIGNLCGHLGEHMTLTLAMSAQVGKIWPSRDYPSFRGNIKICKICGVLALLGSIKCSLGTRIITGRNEPKRQCLMTILPTTAISRSDVDKIADTQKDFTKEVKAIKNAPRIAIPLYVIARFPYLADCIIRIGRRHNIHTVLFEQQRGRQAWRSFVETINAQPLVEFIYENPENQLVVKELVQREAWDALEYLSLLLLSKSKQQRRLLAQNFARSYVARTSADTQRVKLLNSITTYFLLRWCK